MCARACVMYIVYLCLSDSLVDVYTCTYMYLKDLLNVRPNQTNEVKTNGDSDSQFVDATDLNSLSQKRDDRCLNSGIRFLVYREINILTR